ncbi:hypothetical protein [Sphingosinicella rhizophila]|uniref:Uncharacterized protein n=1 Tax=Sphingosinicella rhizophila TaxID=3050082 RepID=A0ABU3QA51_9SPHN|nr:hypothetical protein [Sphingosinicella sp. GR2756]MDT9600263.1 hypothetical protein [Sphingosinicella sp. GR2756]
MDHWTIFALISVAGLMLGVAWPFPSISSDPVARVSRMSWFKTAWLAEIGLFVAWIGQVFYLLSNPALAMSGAGDMLRWGLGFLAGLAAILAFPYVAFRWRSGQGRPLMALAVLCSLYLAAFITRY